jgi:hypothetical protein
LNTIQSVRVEMSRVYRQARSDQLDIDTAARLCNMLRTLADVLRDSDLERRMAELEGTARPQSIGTRGLRSVA